MAKRQGTKCLIEDCDGEAVSRGLCLACYANARNSIKAGRVSEKQLMSKGLLAPSRKGRRPVNPKFFAALEKAFAK